MELRHLRYLVVIADTGAFVRAAEQLRVAQPALTRQMHDLEEELGATLFDPKARRATLTHSGEACARLARHVIQDTGRAVARARLSNSGVVGRCVIAAGNVPLASGLATAFAARMRQRFPGITLVLVERAAEAQWAAIERAEVDIGLGVEPPSSHALLSAATQQVVAMDHVAIAAEHDLARRDSISLADLRDTPMLALEPISPATERIRVAAHAALREVGASASVLEPRLFPSVESMLAHVRAGQGWAFTPGTVGPMLSGIATVKLTGFQAVLPMMRIWRRSDSRPVVRTVLEQLRLYQENRDAEGPEAPSIEGDIDGVPPRLELRHLRSFVAVAQHGSLGRAAEVLGVTQPALSRQMRELEYDTGVALLERESRGVQLTVAGDAFREAAEGVLSIVDQIPRELKRAERAQAQRCVIGAVSDAPVEAMLAQVVADLEARRERIRVGIRSLTTFNQAEALQSADVDIVLGYSFPVGAQPEGMEHFISVPLTEDRISTALLPRNHPLAAKLRLSLAELADVPFVGAGRSLFPAFYDMVFAAFAAGGLRPRIEGEFEGLATCWTVVAQGGGWTLGWQSHLSEPPAGLKAVPLVDFELPWGVTVAYRRDEARLPVLATVDALVAHAKKRSLGVKSSEAGLRVGPHIPEARIP